jgi:hypothetical protein
MAGASHEAGSSAGKPVDDPESTIEINIKTLDSRVHKLRVHKNVRISPAKLAFFLSLCYLSVHGGASPGLGEFNVLLCLVAICIHSR